MLFDYKLRPSLIFLNLNLILLLSFLNLDGTNRIWKDKQINLVDKLIYLTVYSKGFDKIVDTNSKIYFKTGVEYKTIIDNNNKGKNNNQDVSFVTKE